MSIGIVTDDDFQIELEKLQGKMVPSVETVIVEKPIRGRNEGDNNVPNSLRKIIGETAIIDGRAEALKIASEFGISPSSVSAYAKGATSTTSYNEPKKNIVEYLNKSRARAVTKASKTLNGALNAITQEKLDYADVKDLSSIAKEMSVIIKNLEPQQINEPNESKTPQFVIYAPSFRSENSFEVIQVNE